MPRHSVSAKSSPTSLLLVVLMVFLIVEAAVNTAVARKRVQTDVEDRIRPNFIVINIDDLGYGDIGPFGSKTNRTPNLDRMAQEGRKLTCFYAAPVCSPSRASLMTGSYPKRALSIRHVLFPAFATGLADEEVTVAEILHETGYATGIVGKWHLGDQEAFLPTRHGFDSYFGLPYSNDMGPSIDGVKSNLGKPLPRPRPKQKGQPPLPLMRNETVIKRVLAEDQQQLVKRYTQEAVSFLWDHRDEPFFLYLPHSAVHFPLYPSEEFRGKSANGLFGDWVEEVDWSVGQILQTVQQLRLEKRTLVLFTSDNGGQPRHGAVNKPLRGGKGSTFEGGMRVPTIAWWPGTIPAGTETDEITSMMDVLPTFTRLAGGQLQDDHKLDGGDIWPILAGSPDAKTPYEAFYYFRGLKLQAVRSGPWKLHLAKRELYHLGDDIAESKNVAGANPDQVARLIELAEAMDQDLGRDGIGPGCRRLGRVENPRPLIGYDDRIRPDVAPTSVFAGTGIMVGEVTPTQAIAQVRLSQTDELIDGDLPGANGVVEFSLRDRVDGPSLETKLVQAGAATDFVARVRFENLQPDNDYRIHTRLGPNADELTTGPTALFRSHPGANVSRPVRFAVVTGMNYGKFHDGTANGSKPGYQLPDKHLGYPALDSMSRLFPDFFVGTGDNIYYDSPRKGSATNLESMRKKWHEQFVQRRYHQLFSRVPTYWMVDDHDYRVDDCDNTGDYWPTPELGRRVLFEQLPIGMREAEKTYRTVRVSRELQVWFPENRMYRSPNRMEDGPGKSIWGDEQKAWLKTTLRQSDATFKLLVSPTPMIGPDDKRKTDNHTNIGGFRHERKEFFDWLDETGIARAHFYFVCGDRHWQYHAVDPSGLEEFSCGALVDANSRLGRNPGDPQSTDPDATIRQPYSQKKASGGFLIVDSQPADDDRPAQLTFRFHDERGEVLYEHTKSDDRQ